MIKKRKHTKALSTDDQTLWQDVTKSVKPLVARKKSAKALPPPKPLAEKKSVVIRPQTLKTSASAIRPASSGFEIDRRTHDRVKRGQKKIEARLDLHGLRQEEAHDRLCVFIKKSYAAQKRMLLIITGKGERGQGVLRENVPRWLKTGECSSKILTIEQAQIKDGGSGAFYVFLRRER